MAPSPPRTPRWLAGGYFGGGRWRGALFFVLFTLPRGTEEFSVQESRALALLPRHTKAAEQTGGRRAPLAPAAFWCRRPHCQLLHKWLSQLGAVLEAFFFFRPTGGMALGLGPQEH